MGSFPVIRHAVVILILVGEHHIDIDGALNGFAREGVAQKFDRIQAGLKGDLCFPALRVGPGELDIRLAVDLQALEGVGSFAVQPHLGGVGAEALAGI